MSSSEAPTSKLQPGQKSEADPSQTSKTATAQQPVLLEEDDEFEDFPVEGTNLSPRCKVNVNGDDQTGRKKTRKSLGEPPIYGRKAGTTTMRMRILASS